MASYLLGARSGFRASTGEEAIARVIGQHRIGFRGPGYSFSEGTIQVLQRRGYVYDASTLPTFLGPLARAYYFSHADLSEESKERMASLFGSFNDGFRLLRPYRWQAEGALNEDGLIEIPVTTLPTAIFENLWSSRKNLILVDDVV